MVFIGILLSFHVFIPYSVPQYVSSALITFVSAEVLEGNYRSLFSFLFSLVLIYREHKLVVQGLFSCIFCLHCALLDPNYPHSISVIA
jgi:hypothetical protein